MILKETEYLCWASTKSGVDIPRFFKMLNTYELHIFIIHKPKES